MNIQLIDLEAKDFTVIKEIYDYYIIHSTATFHTQEITIGELKESMMVAHPKYKSFLIYYGGEVAGYCYFCPYKKRQAYDRTAEVTIYLKPEYAGKGIGKEVLKRLETVARECGLYVLLGIISGDNEASIALFEKCGYEKCAHFKKVGEKFNQIIDVVAYQKIIRS